MPRAYKISSDHRPSITWFGCIPANVTYEELAALMKKHDFKETKASIASKLSRNNPSLKLSFSVTPGRRTI